MVDGFFSHVMTIALWGIDCLVILDAEYDYEVILRIWGICEEFELNLLRQFTQYTKNFIIALWGIDFLVVLDAEFDYEVLFWIGTSYEEFELNRPCPLRTLGNTMYQRFKS